MGFKMKRVFRRFINLFQRLLNLTKPKYNSTLMDYNLSDSEKGGLYLSQIRKILNSQKMFNNFKRNYIYNIVLEHVSESQGEQYLEVLRKRKDDILQQASSTVFKTDRIGNPRKFEFIEGLISPTTARYVKVASDLRKLFGSDLDSIAEIGCGYGGQTIVSNTLNNYANFTLFDLEDVNMLIKRYLNNFIMNGSFTTYTINEFNGNKKFDLVLSNYAFSELPKELQKKYVEKVLIHSNSGYLTMNSGLFEENLGNKMSLKEIKEYVPNLEIYTEEPKTGPNNYIIVWGNKGKLEKTI